jgi:hypothetical protein
MSERLGGSSVPFRFHGECDPGGREFTAGERSGRSMSNPEHLPYDGVTVEAAR